MEGKLNNGAFPVRRVADICEKIVDGPFGSNLKVEEYQETGIPLIRVSNVRSGVVEGDFVFISEEKQVELKRSRVLPNDVLLTKAGAILGYSAVFPGYLQEGNITSHLVTIRCKAHIIPEYLAIFFRSLLGQRQIYRWGNKSTRPELNTSEVKRIMVVLPPLNIQNQIVEIMQSAYAEKKQKEQEADALLDSIDDYVLAELGIEMPAVEKKKCFVVYANERAGRRIDSHFHQPKYQGFKQALEAGKYRVTPLSSLITDLKNGVEIRTYSDQGYRYLRVSDLGQHGIENHNPRYVDVEEIPNKIKLTSNSFLISRSGSLGLVSVVEDEIREAILSSHIFKVGLNTDQILPRYLEALFRSQIGQTQFFQNNNGGVIPEISQSALKSISVVVPPSDVQEQIAEEAMRQRSEAMKLRQEADAIVEEAKREVERVMLEGVSG